MENEFMTMAEAADALGISNATIWRRVKSGEIEAFESQLDRRRKLIRRSDIEQMLAPVKLDAGKDLATQNLAA